MDLNKFIHDHISGSIAVKSQLMDACGPQIARAVDLVVHSFRNEGKLLLCGNGGSAADAQHIAAEFVVRLRHDLQRPAMPALALSTDTSILTASGNDIGFDNTFARQVEAFGRQGDVLIAISTSGNSGNILQAIHQARKQDVRTILLSGGQGGQAINLADLAIIVPSANTQYIQESHITIGHILCQAVESTLYS